MGNCALAQHCGKHWRVQRRMLERINSIAHCVGRILNRVICWREVVGEIMSRKLYLVGEIMSRKLCLVGEIMSRKLCLVGEIMSRMACLVGKIMGRKVCLVGKIRSRNACLERDIMIRKACLVGESISRKVCLVGETIIKACHLAKTNTMVSMQVLLLHHHQVDVVPAVISHLSGPEKLYTQNQQFI